jgi:hypothetical protein
MQLRSQNLHQNLFSLGAQIQKASKLMIKHRAAKERFDREPRMENLFPVHAALMELNAS